MKARKVKGLDPAGALADNAELIVRTRLDELCSFMPKAEDPGEVAALHDMRIAAKRLRYVLEVTQECFGPYAKTALKLTKDLQDLLGEIHDCDVQGPEVRATLDELMAEDAAALSQDGAGAPPHRDHWAGVVALAVHVRARRATLFEQFLETWRDYERKGFRPRLEYAVAERRGGIISAEQ